MDTGLVFSFHSYPLYDHKEYRNMQLDLKDKVQEGGLPAPNSGVDPSWLDSTGRIKG